MSGRARCRCRAGACVYRTIKKARFGRWSHRIREICAVRGVYCDYSGTPEAASGSLKGDVMNSRVSCAKGGTFDAGSASDLTFEHIALAFEHFAQPWGRFAGRPARTSTGFGHRQRGLRGERCSLNLRGRWMMRFVQWQLRSASGKADCACIPARFRRFLPKRIATSDLRQAILQAGLYLRICVSGGVRAEGLSDVIYRAKSAMNTGDDVLGP